MTAFAASRVELVAEQKTEGYYADRVRQPEWRRQDKLTVIPSNGFASRIERASSSARPEAENSPSGPCSLSNNKAA